ncbi:MAG: hypothetical protein RL154_600 [Pseudomonadota bacterium]
MTEQLLQGVVQFQQNEFEEHAKLFEELKDYQNPHTLFIGCSDSRVVPNLITQTMPGELFVIRNIANLVPPYRVSVDFAATTAAIEYAVLMLNVKAIVVCGHSNCGGISALFWDTDRLSKIPNVKKWLNLANNVRTKAMLFTSDPAKREWHAEQLNIVEQLKNLLTYPFIKERVENEELDLLGWYYIIETGEVYNYNLDIGFFEKVN